MTPKEIAWMIAPAALLGLGLWLLLPRGTAKGRGIGLLFTTISLGLFAGKLWPLEDLVSDAVFYTMAAVTLASAIGAVTMRSPVYCAIWFALTLLGTAGLFFFQGAQFLGVATIVVYAGAILVTFLFVLMLSSPEGNALYDRLSWEAFISAATGAVLVGLLTWTASAAAIGAKPAATVPGAAKSPAVVVFNSSREEQGKNILSTNHVEKLGTELFSRYLAAVEIGGTLLLVALVGAVAVASHGHSAMEESRDA
jgi:NADH-quinone oxidoreductase subunit J